MTCEILEIQGTQETTETTETAEITETLETVEILEMREMVVIQGTMVPRGILQTSEIYPKTFRPNLVQQRQLGSRGSNVKITAMNHVPTRRRNSPLESNARAWSKRR